MNDYIKRTVTDQTEKQTIKIRKQTFQEVYENRKSESGIGIVLNHSLIAVKW